MTLTQPASVETKFERLYEQYRKPILAYCQRRTNRDDAYDAASQTFAIAWRRIDNVPEGDAALRWLYGVAYRTLANQRRSLSRFRKLIDRLGSLRQEDPQPPDVQVVRGVQVKLVLDVMARLRPRDQELLRLVAWEELPREEIAEILGCSRGTVNQRYHRALKRMAKELGNSGYQPTPPQRVDEGGVA
ncbi:MAG: RNA polymerase sigma factor [Acidimicrobiia bacterium]